LAEVNPIYRNKSEFARQMNEHVQTLNAVLNGRRETSITFLNKLFHTFKVNPLYIFFGKGNMLLPESAEFTDDNEKEVKRLEEVVKMLEKDIENKEVVIAAKDETISAQKNENSTLVEQIQLLKSKIGVS
jgi:transcriptional regulator with XRE-family HTH domain